MNNFGQLGLGIKDENYGDGIDNSLIKSGSILIPQPVPKIDNAGNILHIACGGAHTIVIDEFGSVFTCGSNSCGQLGICVYLFLKLTFIYLFLYLFIRSK